MKNSKSHKPKILLEHSKFKVKGKHYTKAQEGPCNLTFTLHLLNRDIINLFTEDPQ